MSQTDEASNEISDADNVSRHIFAPRMGAPEQFIWHEVFEFPSADGNKESVVWRKIAVTYDDVHELGDARAAGQQKLGKISNYIGFLTAQAGEIRNQRTSNGHGFEVYPETQEGPAHAVIKIMIAAGASKLNKSDKIDIRAIMQRLFGPNFSPYSTT
jgi:hypothetical protein